MTPSKSSDYVMCSEGPLPLRPPLGSGRVFNGTLLSRDVSILLFRLLKIIFKVDLIREKSL